MYIYVILPIKNLFLIFLFNHSLIHCFIVCIIVLSPLVFVVNKNIFNLEYLIGKLIERVVFFLIGSVIIIAVQGVFIQMDLLSFTKLISLLLSESFILTSNNFWNTVMNKSQEALSSANTGPGGSGNSGNSILPIDNSRRKSNSDQDTFSEKSTEIGKQEWISFYNEIKKLVDEEIAHRQANNNSQSIRFKDLSNKTLPREKELWRIFIRSNPTLPHQHYPGNAIIHSFKDKEPNKILSALSNQY